MSSLRGHCRHLTWPTNLHFLPEASVKVSGSGRALKTYTLPLPRINENEDPFSHFLSPVLEEEDTFDETSYSAGITPYETEPTSLKDALFRARLEEKWETYVARRLLKHSNKSRPGSIPAPLPPPFPQEPCTPPEEDALPDLVDCDLASTPEQLSSSPDQMQWYFPSTMASYDNECAIVEDDAFLEDIDGWEADRQRGRSMYCQRPVTRKPRTNSFRTLSGKRHAWREPTPDLYTLEEENEDEFTDEEDDRGRGRGRKSRKRAKFVHWNEEVTVMEYER